MRRTLVVLSLIAPISAIARCAGAGVPAGAEIGSADILATNQALAQTLFNDGRRLMEAGQYAQACPKFTESHRLDPAGGTVLNLAVCHDREGRTASAFEEFRDALGWAEKEGNAARIDLARRRMAALEPVLSRLSLRLAPDADITRLRITLDGKELFREAWAVAAPADPGPHTIEATAPGKVAWRTEVRIDRAGQAVEVPIPRLVDAVPIVKEAEPPVAPGTHEGGGSGRNAAGFVALALGAAGVGAGTYFGLRAFSKWHDRNDNCSNGICNDQAVEDARSTDHAALGADVSFGIGIVGAGVGAYLLLTSRSASAKDASTGGLAVATPLHLAPRVAREGFGFELGGAF
jgi:hypothetical protein